jgi:hypothetical protein
MEIPLLAVDGGTAVLDRQCHRGLIVFERTLSGSAMGRDDWANADRPHHDGFAMEPPMNWNVLEEESPGRWQMLVTLAATLVLSMTTWFSASAVISQLREEWHLSASAAAWLTIAVQLGFVCGALVSSFLMVGDN